MTFIITQDIQTSPNSALKTRPRPKPKVATPTPIIISRPIDEDTVEAALSNK